MVEHHGSDRELLLQIIKATLGAVSVMVLLVLIGDYNTQASGPIVRSSDQYSIFFNIATSLRRLVGREPAGSGPDEL